MIKKFYRLLSPKFQPLFLEYKVKFEPRYDMTNPHPILNEIIGGNHDFYRENLKRCRKYIPKLQEIRTQELEEDISKPVWNNGYLPGLDIAMIYAFIAQYKPSRYVEIGSGNSTKVAYKSKLDNELSTRITSIDPAPRAEIDALADEVIRKPFESIDHNLILDLNENDILFVDNSHRILPNSDAMVFFMEILPRLKKGVLVHIHDIYLPYDYPQFMCDRGYSEQYGLAIYLMANPSRYHTLMPNYYVSEDPELRNIMADLWQHKNLQDVERHGGSYWLRINK